MNLYLAASSAETGRVASALAALADRGITVVCTWPAVVSATPGGANPVDASRESRAGWSRQDLAEVASCDVLWFLVPSPPVTTRGAWIEAGYALALGKRVVFSGATMQSVFCALGEEYRTDAEALIAIAACDCTADRGQHANFCPARCAP